VTRSASIAPHTPLACRNSHVEEAPVVKRKGDSSAASEHSAKAAKTSAKRSLPQFVAPKPASSSEQFPSSSTDHAVQPICDLHWPTIPPRDPIRDIFCEDGDDTSQTSSTEPSATETSYSLLRSPPPVPTSDIPSSDLPYFTFFLEQMSNILPYVNLFPSAPSSVFSVSLQHPALRHSILSISALIADKKSDLGRVRALDHMQKSLKHLQTSLSAVEVDEGMAISIFLLAYFNVGSGEHATARKHLHGLHMVLEQLKRDHLVRDGGLPSPHAISPLTMLIWRMAIRMDFIMSIMYGQPPIFPVYVRQLVHSDDSIAEDQEEFHRQWITLFADRNQGPSASEWALAWFALDNTMHRACHASADALVLRRSNTTTAASQETDKLIQSSVDTLLTNHRKWRQRKVVREADAMERQGQLLATMASNMSSGFPFDTILPTLQQNAPPATPGGTPLQFLHYPPERLTNFFYSNLLNHYRSIEIYISLIPKPMWGYPDPWRLECAIDLCRTHAALGEERNFLTTGKIWGLYLAGVTFGGHELYPVCLLESEH